MVKQGDELKELAAKHEYLNERLRKEKEEFEATKRQTKRQHAKYDKEMVINRGKQAEGQKRKESVEGFHGNRRVGSKERIRKERENKREGIREDSSNTTWREVSA